MDKIIAPESIVRTTLDQTEDLPLTGIYIIAYMGRIVYVGKAMYSVARRITQHYNNGLNECLGEWLHKVQLDWCNVRLDVLEPPNTVEARYWLRQAEAALIREFRPLFNNLMNHA